MATLIAIIFSLAIFLGWGFYFEPLPTDVISYTEGFYGLGYLLALIVALSWNKIRITPLVGVLFAYPFFTFAIAVFLATRVVPNGLYIVPIWFLITGLATDGFLWLMKESNPPTFADMKRRIRHAKSIFDYQEGIDAITENVAKSISHSSVSQIHTALNVFASSYDNIHGKEGLEVKVLYPLEMLEMLCRNAIEKNLTVAAQRIFTTLGTLGLACLNTNPDLAPFAINKIEQGTLLALRKQQAELYIKGCLTLQQTALLALDQNNWGPFLAQIVRSLNLLAKESFKMDKDQPVMQLITPVLEIDKALKNYEKSADYPMAKMEIDKTIEEFKTLDAVLKQMPKIEESVR